MLALLERLAERTSPWILVNEDAHWAGTGPSRDLLAFLVGRQKISGRS